LPGDTRRPAVGRLEERVWAAADLVLEQKEVTKKCVVKASLLIKWFWLDGKVLPSADRYPVKLWEATGREHPALSKGVKGGHSVALAPQGFILATVCKTIKTPISCLEKLFTTTL
jgi:hypothetical protein